MLKCYKLSEETRKRMSDAAKNRSVESEARRLSKVAEAVRRPEIREKIRKTLTGRKRPKLTEEWRLKISNTHKQKVLNGECYNYKGNREENSKIRSSIEYRLWRESVFSRDMFICQMPSCDQTERYLEAHHIKTFKEYPSLRFEASNGITLCRTCHNKTKFKESEYEVMLTEIIKARAEVWS